MDELQQWYKENLSARIDALEVARSIFDQNQDKGIQFIKRIAHALKGSGATYGFQDITYAAEELESASNKEILLKFECLIKILKDIVAVDDDECFDLSDGKGKTGILIVDDDKTICHIIEKKLSSPKRIIHIAHSASEAYKLIDSYPIALIIIDIVLPDDDGRNLLVKLRENLRTASVTIFMLSSMIGTQVKTECYALGADDFFEKPLDCDSFVAFVTARLHKDRKIAHRLHNDPLTDLLNRVALTEAFDRNLAYAKRSKEELSIAIIDLDFFKTVNDTYGHSMGDKVLKEFSIIIVNALRKSDILGRWGGEEFVVLFPNTSEEGAKNALIKVLDTMRHHRFLMTSKNTSISLTFSAGVSSIDLEGSFADNIDKVDKLLYMAKMTGRNIILSSKDQHYSLKIKVLLAEDDKFISRIVIKQLEEEGFDVDYFENGLSALKALKKTTTLQNYYNLILLDVNMPLMDGFEVLEKARKLSYYANIPIIMLTSKDRKKDIIYGIQHGASDYVVKPFNPRRLVDRIRAVLRSNILIK